MIDTRTRIVAVAGCLGLLVLIIELVRRRRMKEEYSVLWIGTGLVLLVLAAWYQLLGWITRAIGGVALSSTLFFLGLLFAFLMLLHFSIRVSALERRLTALVQEIGILTASGGDGGDDHEPPAARSGADPQASPSDPRVAVIIPCYNDGAVVREAIGSIEEREPVEVVVVDDGSDDPGTLDVLARLEADGTRVVRRENGGLAAARATGLDATRAPLVYPLDADDLLDPGALGALADTLERHPQAGFAWGDYTLFGDYDGSYRAPSRWLPWTLTYVNPYPVSSMFRRSVLQQAGDWRGAPGAQLVGAHGYEDWDLWLRLVKLGVEGVYAGRSIYRRRLHGGSRLLAHARKRHQDLYRELVERNAEVFERRTLLRGSERPPFWKPFVYPILFGSRTVVPFRVEAFLQRTMMRLGLGLPGS
ncbi:MAG TPA: DUF2304 family protein [Conexibacter sp.]|nr:DUF2304 family protein [Conexibacter sp.]